MAKKTKKEEPFRSEGPLTEEEMKHWGWRMAIKRAMNGPGSVGLFDTEERAFHELRAYRSAKRMEVLMDETFSSMGTSQITICKDVEGKERHFLNNFPMNELGFDTSRGQRFLLFVLPLPADKKMKPRKNPFQEKRRGRRRA
jgi:hypothetical protein